MLWSPQGTLARLTPAHGCCVLMSGLFPDMSFHFFVAFVANVNEISVTLTQGGKDLEVRVRAWGQHPLVQHLIQIHCDMGATAKELVLAGANAKPLAPVFWFNRWRTPTSPTAGQDDGRAVNQTDAFFQVRI
jgi:hypothetical protein